MWGNSIIVSCNCLVSHVEPLLLSIKRSTGRSFLNIPAMINAGIILESRPEHAAHVVWQIVRRQTNKNLESFEFELQIMILA